MNQEDTNQEDTSLSRNESIHLIKASALTTVLYCWCVKGEDKKKFNNEDNEHAEVKMLNEGPPYPIEMWMSYTPCFDCAVKLIEAYKDKVKPEIHAKKVYKGKHSKNGCSNLHLRGLAALFNDGFKIKIMGTEVYEDFVGEQCDLLKLSEKVCHKLGSTCLIKDYYSSEFFESLNLLWMKKILIANVVIVECRSLCILLTLFSNGSKEMDPITFPREQEEQEKKAAQKRWRGNLIGHITRNNWTKDDNHIVVGYSPHVQGDVIKAQIQYVQVTYLKEKDKVQLLTTEDIIKKFENSEDPMELWTTLKWNEDEKMYL